MLKLLRLSWTASIAKSWSKDEEYERQYHKKDQTVG